MLRFGSTKIIIILLLCFGSLAANGPIKINEFLASSTSSILDPDYSQYVDWIELYNSGDSDIDIGGYFITDDLSESTKWEIPSETEIPANGYLLIWADSMDDTLKSLHTNFKLSNSGESIGLFTKEGEVCDTLTFAQQNTDISYGRDVNNPNDWLYFENPTPGETNTTKGLPYRTQAGVPSISHESGFYQNLLNLTISAPPQAEIRYTTDGSLPIRTSPIYKEPIVISQTTVLNIRIYMRALLPGPVVTRTFFINEEKKLPTISLTTDAENLWSSEKGIYIDENIVRRRDWERPAVMEYFDPYNELAFTDDIKIRLFGRSAIHIPQKSLSFFLSNTLEYPLFGRAYTNHFDSFILRSSSDDWHLTMFRDAYIQTLLRQSLSIDTQAASQAVLYINGEYWGIHNIREKYNEDYIASHHNIDRENIDLVYIDERSNTVELLAGDLEEYTVLMDFISSNSLEAEANYEVVAGMVDIDNFLDYVIAEAFIGNTSWAHNIRAWRPRTADGKWQWLIFDLDRGFRTIDFNALEDMSQRFPLFASLLQNQSFRNLLLSKFTDYLNGVFLPERTVSILDSMQATIALEIPAHIKKWNGICNNGVCGISSVSSWEDDVAAMRNIVTQRPGIVRQQLTSFYKSEEIVQLELSIQQPGFGRVEINNQTSLKENYTGLFFKGTILQLQAQANDGYEFVGWREGSTSVTTLIAQGSEWRYYDQGASPDSSWNMPEFDDSGWQSGAAQLGYGDGDETTIVDFGPSEDAKHITTYFRIPFQAQSISDISGLVLKLLKDDGAVVYINGVEVVRSNMPAGVIDFNTEADASISGNNEDSFSEFPISPENLVDGENILAVEIHQNKGASSDISFDLELSGIWGNGQNLISTETAFNLELSNNLLLNAVFEAKIANQLPEQITETLFLSSVNSPYIATGDITISPDVTMTIEPGVTIQISEGASILVNGNLIANGSEDAPIIFQAIGGNTWGALLFENTTDESMLSHVQISGATNGPDSLYRKAAISTYEAHLTLDYVTIENVKQPFYGRGGTIEITNSTLDGTQAGDDLVNIQHASARMENNHLFGNGELDFDFVDDGVIRGNRIDIISDNPNRDGIDIGSSLNILIENNQVYNCPDKGISIGEQSTAFLGGNQIINTGIAIAVKDNSIARIDRNTFYNDSVGVACYEKNEGRGGGNAIVTNTIFAESYAADFSIDVLSTIEISYSLSNKTELEGIGNINAEPLFISEGTFDFGLLEESPCVDGGDPESTKDLDSTRADIGARQYYFGPGNITEIFINEFMASNNETIADEAGAFEDWVEIYNASEMPVNVAGLYLTDNLLNPTLWRIPTDSPETTTIPPGGFLLIWADEDINQGTFHADFRLSADGEQIGLIRKDKTDTVMVDSIVFAVQDQDISYGRAVDGGNTWQIFTTPTPGTANNQQATEVEEKDINPELPERFIVHQNYPNPFNPVTTIAFELPETANVSVDVFNAIGQKVSKLYEGEKPAGVHQVEWNGTFDDGFTASSGIYFYKVVAGGKSFVHKMVLMR